MDIKELKPEALWNNFYFLTQIPRPSHHEEMARQKVLAWASEHNIHAEMDAIGNILMSAPATPGYENRPGIILQGHLDMVPQKNEDTVHDFTKDPIQTVVDGEWLRAKGTTLGADNGIGVAIGMTILESDTLEHGPIEVLVTATEETGMDGAKGIQSNWVQGNILLNLDSEDEGELYVGCAGGLDSHIEFKYTQEFIPDGFVAYRIGVKGLRGGHSGMDINLGRGNSNKLLFRFLKEYADKLSLRISTIEGGSLRNAIPRESFVTVTLPVTSVADLQKAVADTEAIYRAELSAKDGGVTVEAIPCTRPAFVIDSCTQHRLINAVVAIPSGVKRMDDNMPGTVETSNNLAIVKSYDGYIQINTLMRSSVDTAKDALAQQIQAVAELAKADVIRFEGRYPGWKPNPDSPILHKMQTLYKQLFGNDPKVMAVHAGLECGILGSTYPGWDMISLGPTIRHPHSPDEKVNIKSVEKFYQFIVEAIKA